MIFENYGSRIPRRFNSCKWFHMSLCHYYYLQMLRHYMLMYTTQLNIDETLTNAKLCKLNVIHIVLTENDAVKFMYFIEWPRRTLLCVCVADRSSGKELLHGIRILFLWPDFSFSLPLLMKELKLQPNFLVVKWLGQMDPLNSPTTATTSSPHLNSSVVWPLSLPNSRF